jgi:hypothetical protein
MVGTTTIVGIEDGAGRVKHKHRDRLLGSHSRGVACIAQRGMTWRCICFTLFCITHDRG